MLGEAREAWQSFGSLVKLGEACNCFARLKKLRGNVKRLGKLGEAWRSLEKLEQVHECTWMGLPNLLG